MKVGEMFKRKAAGKQKPSQQFTPEQAAANRALYEQEIGPLGQGATLFFQEFYIGSKVRRWLLPASVETWKDLNDEQVNYVLQYVDWFKRQIKPIHEQITQDLPWT